MIQKIQTVCAIVVTHNRLALLQECIAALRAQKRSVDQILVVDNDSTDGSNDWLSEQKDLCVVSQCNSGATGGFYRGICEAFSKKFDWFWLMDDDTIPDEECLDELIKVADLEKAPIGYLASLVLWTDGNLHEMCPLQVVPDNGWMRTIMERPIVPIRASSYVSCLVSREAVERVGLPLREMFIWYDDVEFTQRVSAVFPCYGVLSSTVVHKTKLNTGVAGTHVSPETLFKHRFKWRNRTFLICQEQNLWKRWSRLLHYTISEIKGLPNIRFLPTILSAIISGLFFHPCVQFPKSIVLDPRAGKQHRTMGRFLERVMHFDERTY